MPAVTSQQVLHLFAARFRDVSKYWLAAARFNEHGQRAG